MACYNWGEIRCFLWCAACGQPQAAQFFWKLSPTMGANGFRTRLMTMYFRLCAAVIGENPRLFGFDSTNPRRSRPRQGGKRRFCAGGVNAADARKREACSN